MAQAIFVGSLLGHMSNILELNSSNFGDWKQRLLIMLRCLDLDLCLQINELENLTETSSSKQ